jgi:hypothetical protein
MQITPGNPIYLDYSSTFVLSQNGTRTTSSVVARYTQAGKRVHAWGKAVISQTGSAGNAILMSLPVNCHASLATINATFGTGVVADLGTIWMPALVVGFSGSEVGFTKTNGDVQALIGVTPSFAVASGDFIGWDITYEAA